MELCGRRVDSYIARMGRHQGVGSFGGWAGLGWLVTHRGAEDEFVEAPVSRHLYGLDFLRFEHLSFRRRGPRGGGGSSGAPDRRLPPVRIGAGRVLRVPRHGGAGAPGTDRLRDTE